MAANLTDRGSLQVNAAPQSPAARCGRWTVSSGSPAFRHYPKCGVKTCRAAWPVRLRDARWPASRALSAPRMSPAAHRDGFLDDDLVTILRESLGRHVILRVWIGTICHDLQLGLMNGVLRGAGYARNSQIRRRIIAVCAAPAPQSFVFRRPGAGNPVPGRESFAACHPYNTAPYTNTQTPKSLASSTRVWRHVRCCRPM